MCYNCGCGMSDDDMGQGHALAEAHGRSITDHTFDHLAKDWNMTPEEAKELVFGMLTGTTQDKEKHAFMEHLYDEAAKSQGMTKEQAKEDTLKLLKKVLKK